MTEPKEQVVKYVIPKRIVAAFVIMGALMFLILCGFAWVIVDVRDLGQQNKHNITDIQKNRLEACVGIYSGIHTVFLPFFPTKPSDKEQSDLDKFNGLITKLTKKCEIQVKTKVDK